MSVNKDQKTNTWYYEYHDRFGVHRKQRGFKTKRDAKAAEIESKRQKLRSDITYLNVHNEILQIYKEHASKRSYSEFESIHRNHIAPLLLNKPLHKYERYDCEMMMRSAVQSGKSTNIANKILKQMNTVFNYAVRHDYVDRNPFAGIPRLKHTKQISDYLSYHEFSAVIANEDRPMYKLLWELAFWTGMRRGEILALTWSDIDYFNSRISVNKHIVYAEKKRTIVKGRKNKNSYFVEMDHLLEEHIKEFHEVKKKTAGYTDNFFIFGDFRSLPEETLRSNFKKALKKAGVKPVTFHSARHSHVSFLYNYTDLSIQEIARRIGDTVEVTLKVYAHIFEARKGTYSNAISSARNELSKAKISSKRTAEERASGGGEDNTK